MVWGSFGIVHISSLLIGAGIIVGLYYLLRNRSSKTQMIVLGILSLYGVVSTFYNLFNWGSPYEYLPLHLCSLTALTLPIAIFTRSKALSNLLLLWSLGAIMALVVNTAQANYELCSAAFILYYGHHLLEFGIPILLFALGLVKKDYKCIGSTLLITFVTFALVHFANLWLNSYFIANNITNPSGELIQVNYMYTLYSENPVMDLFWSIIPYPFWYMMPVLLIIAVYLVLVYLNQIIPLFKKKGA